MSHWFHENWATGWIRYPVTPPDHLLTKLYACYEQYYKSGFWKRLWIRVKIWYYKRLIRRLKGNE